MASTSTYCMLALALVLLAASTTSSAIVPVAAPLAAVAPYASSYNAHTIHHNVAAPVATAPYVAAPLAAAPYVAAPYAAAPYVAAPYAAAPYTAAPYFASPYVAPANYLLK